MHCLTVLFNIESMKNNTSKIHHLGVRLTTKEQQLLDKVARKLDLSKSDCTRLILLDGLTRVLKEGMKNE